MTQTNHTPGPWCVAPLDGVYHGDASKTKYHSVKKFWPMSGAYERVADCTDSAYPEANARLIAAAPDLLEALDRLVALVNVSGEDFSDSPGIIRADHAAMINALAALAKAMPSELPGHERKAHWFDADRSGFSETPL